MIFSGHQKKFGGSLHGRQTSRTSPEYGLDLDTVTTMSSFFTIPGAQKKRKRQETQSEGPKKRFATSSHSNSKSKSAGKAAARPNHPASKKRVERDLSISGSDSDDDDDSDGYEGLDQAGEDSEEDSEVEGETAAERRLRLAERYLENVKQEVDDEYGFDAEEIDRDLLAERLQEDIAETKGKVYRKLAGELAFEQASHTLFRWNSENVTSIATCAPYAYTVSRDMYLVKWKLQDLPQYQWPQTTKKKPKKPPAPPKKKPQRIASSRGDTRKTKDKNYQGHTGPILTVAASQDGKYIVTGGADRRMVVHDAETMKPIRAFSQHRDAVTGLAFRRGTNQLYSCSKDRTVKVWSLDELAYVETLFGHQDHVVDIDALAHERCLSAGARDRTARLWKVVEETQLVFRGGAVDKKPKPGIDTRSLAHEGSMDRVAMIDEELFVTGSDNGAIALWSTTKKKPLFILPHAHGMDPALTPEEASGEKNPIPEAIPPPQPRWITALRTIPYSDVILSGSWDGHVRVWRLSDDKKKIERVGVLGARSDEDGAVLTNGVNGTESASSQEKPASDLGYIKGMVNDISCFERGDRGKDGLCIVIALGKEHRLGRWKKFEGGRNGAMVFEVPKPPTPEAVVTNGVHPPGDEDSPAGEKKPAKA